ncbi:hypothetical protein J3458_019316 [Metarhizium acridum]|uniref:uncharacterized protein n=1 Tax=Metarhizium acridum TaxID=92637 RepID=UPI001C6C99DE|nr:hypothetical protein J3458_019316 [Metarhizium acridum]
MRQTLQLQLHASALRVMSTVNFAWLLTNEHATYTPVEQSHRAKTTGNAPSQQDDTSPVSSYSKPTVAPQSAKSTLRRPQQSSSSKPPGQAAITRTPSLSYIIPVDFTRSLSPAHNVHVSRQEKLAVSQTLRTGRTSSREERGKRDTGSQNRIHNVRR